MLEFYSVANVEKIVLTDKKALSDEITRNLKWTKKIYNNYRILEYRNLE